MLDPQLFCHLGTRCFSGGCGGGGKVGVSWWMPQAQVEKNMFGVMSSWKIQTGIPTLSNDRSRWCICEGQALCMLGSPRPKKCCFLTCI